MFCKFCGKELLEGEVCACEAAGQKIAVSPETPVPAEKSSNLITEAFCGIPAVVKQWVKNTHNKMIPVSTCVILALVEIAVHVISWMLLAGTLTDAIGSRLRGINQTAAWCGLMTIITALLVGFLIPVIGQLIKKEKICWKENLSTTVSVALLPSILFVAGALLCMVSFKMGITVIALAAMTGIAECCRQTRGMLFEGQGIWVTLACAVVPAVIAVVIGNTVYDVIAHYLDEIIKSLIFGSLW